MERTTAVTSSNHSTEAQCVRMGIAQRLERVFAIPETSEQQARSLFQAFKMIVGQEPGQMGAKFKALRVVSPVMPESVEC